MNRINFPTVVLGFLGLATLQLWAAETNPAIARAMASVREVVPRAQADPTRPVYHFIAPANWMNDPNGPIYHRGYYHMFYQHNPYGDNWGNMHWGHARSRDLVRWEHLPIALWPSKERGEDHCFSGCATLDSEGRPMIFYTSIGQGKRAEDYAEQWAAIGDKNMLAWRKHEANPLLTEKSHGALKVYDWRDPFLFQHEGKDYLVLGGNLNQRKGGQAIVLLYEAENKQLSQWKYRGVLFIHPNPRVVNIECPNFFRLNDRWVLVISPHGKVEYFTGSFDPKAGKFIPEHRGLVDESGHYYAPNCLLDPKNRRVMWGWVRGFKSALGWNGCLTLPRILSVDSHGALVQKPAPELERLRGKQVRRSRMALRDEGQLLNVQGDALEILAEFDRSEAATYGLRVRRSDDGQRSVPISFDGKELRIADITAPFSLRENEKTLKLHVFLDKSVVEVFVNDRACLTRVMNAGIDDLGVELFAQNGSAHVANIMAWRLKSIR